MLDRRIFLAAACFASAWVASARDARAQCLDWSALGGHVNVYVTNMAVFDDGSGPGLYIGGAFTAISGIPMRIARWNGTSWSPLGSGVDEAVTAMIVFDDGSGPALYVGGRFSTAGGSPASRIAKWDGASWSSVGGGLPGGQTEVYALGVYDDGGGPELYASTWIGDGCIGITGTILKLSGGTWTTIGTADDGVSSFAVYDGGSGPELYVGGHFFSVEGVSANAIAKWNGSVWSSVGSGMGWGGGFCTLVASLAVYDDGGGPKLYAGGEFGRAGGTCAMSIAAWDGSSWSALGLGVGGGPTCCNPTQCTSSSNVRALAVFDDGSGPELYAAGNFQGVGGMPSGANIGKWNGTAWSTVGAGLSSTTSALAVFDDGLGGGPDLYAAGAFMAPARFIARWRGCGGPATHFCPGDGTTAACPCGNSGAVLRGCENSAATRGALLQATGTASPDTVGLHVSGELPSSLTIYLQGNATGAPGVPFGDGLRCVTGILKRLYVKSASGGYVTAPSGADPSITARSAALGDPIAAGERRYYQTYYRDSNAGFCTPPSGSTFNASSGLRIVW